MCLLKLLSSSYTIRIKWFNFFLALFSNSFLFSPTVCISLPLMSSRVLVQCTFFCSFSQKKERIFLFICFLPWISDIFPWPFHCSRSLFVLLMMMVQTEIVIKERTSACLVAYRIVNIQNTSRHSHAYIRFLFKTYSAFFFLQPVYAFIMRKRASQWNKKEALTGWRRHMMTMKKASLSSSLHHSACIFFFLLRELHSHNFSLLLCHAKNVCI